VVQLKGPGTYFVRVATSDGVWQSPAQLVYAIEPPNATWAGSSKSLHLGKDVSLLYPPDKLTIAPVSLPASIRFLWDTDRQEAGFTYLLKVATPKGQVVAEVRSRGRQALVPLPPGQYVWSIDSAGISGEHRQFEILDPRSVSTGGERLKILWHLIDARKDARLALDMGL
jgi:hypothetical protein